MLKVHGRGKSILELREINNSIDLDDCYRFAIVSLRRNRVISEIVYSFGLRGESDIDG